MDKLEGYDELIEQALAKMPASVRLKGLSPEERLQDLKLEEQILALSDEALRLLRPEAFDQLSSEARAEIARRLARH